MRVKWGNVAALILCLLVSSTIRNASQTSWLFVLPMSGLLYAAYLAVDRSLSE